MFVAYDCCVVSCWGVLCAFVMLCVECVVVMCCGGVCVSFCYSL